MAVVEYILLSPCPDAKGWTCGFLLIRSDLTFTRGMKNNTPPMVTPFTKPNGGIAQKWIPNSIQQLMFGGVKIDVNFEKLILYKIIKQIEVE